MAISFVGGKPGAGKTLYSVGLIVRELMTTDRLVVTNVPLKVERLNEYLQEQCPDKVIPLVGPNRRLILLDDNNDARELYHEYSKKYYGTKNAEQREAIFRDYEQQIKTLSITEEARTFWEFRSQPGRRFEEDTGALIVLDELHIHFNARKWMATGDACLHYLSQHRKLGDDVICITQALGNVDKQFRSVAEDFTIIINESKRRIGPFKGRNRFVRASYYKEPQGNRDQPFERVAFQLDAAGVASCYDTAAGVGVHGNKADTRKKTKGLPIMLVLPAAIVVVAVIVGVIPFALARATGTYMTSESNNKGTQQALAETAASSRAALVGRFEEADQFTDRSAADNRKVDDIVGVPTFQPAQYPADPLYVNGLVILNRPGQLGRFSISLSDGRTITETDGVVQAVTRNRVKLTNGQELWIGRFAERRSQAKSVEIAQSNDSVGVSE